MSTNREFDRIPPFNLEAERSVLGSCLIDRDSLLIVIESLRTDDFYDPRHRTAFEIIASMAEQDCAVDSLTFREEVKKRGLEDRLGGLPFVAELMDAVTTTANVEYHVSIVRDKSVHRGLITVGSDISRMGFSEEIGIDEALETAEQKVFEIARTGRSARLKGAREVVSSAIGEIEKRLAGGLEITGVPSGFTDFDKLSGGLQPGSLYILAARPSMGKTAFALNVAQHAALQEDIPVLMFSLEMSAEQIAQRMLAAESEVNLREMFESRRVQNEQWQKLSKAAGRLSKSPIYIDDSSTLNTLDLRGRCRRFFAKHRAGKGLVVLDYLQLMNVARKIENRQQEVSEISRALKGIAREFKVPVLALSQLSRDVEKRGGSKKPQLSDLRDSGAIEQDADMVIFLYREAYYAQEGETVDPTSEVIVAKNRNGPTGKVDLIFFKECARFASKLSGNY
ncbi:MAG TPA: replicative DNA helicase [Synergistaceae bacterium]|uniref:replicative DNA helicase n=1 Tax=Synergistaceae TaxID=649777 RepID=UPI000ED226F1|nr:replicative DNA helicase [Synergistaceae bacterium DZ-S4]HAH69494.1 replicative DNA helicase [Synergistaceae bacterium]